MITVGTQYTLAIRRTIMINKVFWGEVAEEWKKTDDGIYIPQEDSGGAESIIHENNMIENILDDEIEEILKEFDIKL